MQALHLHGHDPKSSHDNNHQTNQYVFHPLILSPPEFVLNLYEHTLYQ
ncbi:protein of unknown function [Shewanella benthica]|uniref:Uncharacterized protein n=1 Tax=Shewanella benthica TaxID=43661 RepID=A0A330M6Q9_9GAMM|nr:protein of unknown function [Shewanella benthica]